MDYEHIIYAVEDGILTITLNRPDKLNAFTEQMRTEIMDALDKADADDDVRAIIFTGAGRGYCAGADLSRGGSTFDYSKRGYAEGEVVRDGGGVMTLRIYQCKKPVIGAITGPAVGVGSTMQLPMDIRIASEKARFGFVFAQRGVVPEACSSYFLPRLVGISQALDWAYSGRVFEADEALKGGLVKEVVPHDQLLPRAREIAKSYMERSSAVSVAM
ncbi:MAG: enoyl-CoA hydratase-related protein, partial [Parvibaculum sp.]